MQTTSHIDFDLHGLVGIRLIDASPADAKVVARQLGPIQAPLDREPDIRIRFVDKLPMSSPMRYLGLDEAGFTEDAFLILRSKQKARSKIQIPFEQIGRGCEIVCERGLPSVPLLLAIVNLTALGKDILPLHASAFSYGNTEALITGWAKGGKTETLLGFMANGANYIGDEWIYLNADGTRMFGIPEPIRFWYWHLQELPKFWSTLSRGKRFKMSALGRVSGMLETIIDSGIAPNSSPVRFLQRLLPVVKRQNWVQVPPSEMFGANGALTLGGPPQKLFFVVSHEKPDITVQPVSSDEIAKRMIHSLQDELLPFMAYYLKFKFAFPDKSCRLVEEAQQRQSDLLNRLLVDREAYEVRHPYPVSIPQLYQAVKEFV